MSNPGTYANGGNTGLGDFARADDDVATNVAKAADSSSPLVQQARQAGVDQANSRGLLNSTVAGQASQAEAYKVALPIGTQNATQAAAKNLSNQQFEQTNETAGAQNQSQERIATQAQNAETARTSATLASNESIASQDAQNKLALQQMQSASSESIARMNVTSNAQDKAQNAALTASNIYASMVNNINSNTSIPADQRQALLQNALDEQNSNIALIEQLYNVQLNWGSPANPSSAGGGSSAASSASGGGQAQSTGSTRQVTIDNNYGGYNIAGGYAIVDDVTGKQVGDAAGNSYDSDGNVI